MRRGALEPGGVLIGVEPPPEVLEGVEPIDHAVLAARRALGTEHFDAHVARKPGRRLDDALKEALVEGLVTGLDPGGHGRGDGTPGRFGLRIRVRVGRVPAVQARSSSLNWTSPIVFPPGSTNQADSANPMSATPPVVLRPGSSYSTTSTP